MWEKKNKELRILPLLLIFIILHCLKMTALFLLLAFCLGLFVFSMVAYKKYRKFIVAMAYSEKCRLFYICLTGILIIGFHLVYYAAQPHDMGIMISTIFLFASFATKHMLQLFVYIRSKRNLYTALGLVTVVFAFVPYMFTTSVTFAIALIGISLLPTDRQIHKRRLKSSSHIG